VSTTDIATIFVLRRAERHARCVVVVKRTKATMLANIQPQARSNAFDGQFTKLFQLRFREKVFRHNKAILRLTIRNNLKGKINLFLLGVFIIYIPPLPRFVNLNAACLSYFNLWVLGSNLLMFLPIPPQLDYTEG
jgi:hypothetical protein